jgi:hypothetical protein
MAPKHWGSTTALVVEAKKREMVLGRVCLGLPSSLDAKQNRTNRRKFARSLDTREEDPQQISFPPWSACKGSEKREKRKGNTRVHLAEFEFKI